MGCQPSERKGPPTPNLTGADAHHQRAGTDEAIVGAQHQRPQPRRPVAVVAAGRAGRQGRDGRRRQAVSSALPLRCASIARLSFSICCFSWRQSCGLQTSRQLGWSGTGTVLLMGPNT